MSGAQPPADPLGAFCRENHVALAGSGTGPLAGLTFAAKDVFHVAGARTGFGQPDWLRTHRPARETAKAVSLLLDAGAELVGRTVSDELTYSLTGENAHYGTPENPHDARRVAGGSSGGSAAAVAGGLVDVALGTDCAGSVRIPASYCGLLGLRPTHGRVAIDGVLPLAPSFDVVGWFARDADAFTRVGWVLLGEDDAVAPPRRLLRARDAFAPLEAAAAEALEPAIGTVAGQLEAQDEVQVAPDGLTAWFEAFRTLQAAEIWQSLGGWVEAVGPTLGPGVAERIAWASTVTCAQIEAAAVVRGQAIARLGALLAPGCVLCLPTSPRVAPQKGLPCDEVEVEFRHSAMRLLCIATLAGLPQVNLPLATLEGMPLGLSLVAPRGSDRALVELSASVMASAPSRPSPTVVG